MEYISFEQKLLSFFGELTKNDFRVSPIWYQCYDYSEMQYLIKQENISESWINTHCIEMIESKDEHPYYTLVDKKYLPLSEFSFVKCKAFINEKIIDGYFSIINNELNVLSLFLDDKVFDLYGSQLFQEEDAEVIKFLSGYYNDRSMLNIKTIKYKLDDSVLSYFDLEGEFELNTTDA